MLWNQEEGELLRPKSRQKTTKNVAEKGPRKNRVPSKHSETTAPKKSTKTRAEVHAEVHEPPKQFRMDTGDSPSDTESEYSGGGSLDGASSRDASLTDIPNLSQQNIELNARCLVMDQLIQQLLNKPTREQSNQA